MCMGLNMMILNDYSGQVILFIHNFRSIMGSYSIDGSHKGVKSHYFELWKDNRDI